MGRIVYFDRVLNSLDDGSVRIEIGQASDPALPFFMMVGGLSWKMTERNTSWLTYAGERASQRLDQAARNGAAPAAANLLRQSLGVDGAEIKLGIFVDDQPAGVELHFYDRDFRFTDENCALFLTALATLHDEVREWRRAQPGGVQQLAIRPDWGFERKNW